MPVFTDVRIENGNMIIFTAPIETTWETIEKELEDRYVKGYKEYAWRWRGFKLDTEWKISVWKNPMVEDSDEEDEEDEEDDFDVDNVDSPNILPYKKCSVCDDRKSCGSYDVNKKWFCEECYKEE
jgi:hypothetical protein